MPGMVKKLAAYFYLVLFFISSFVIALADSGGTGGATGGSGGATGGTGGRGILELVNPLGSRNIIDIINNILNYLIYISVPILALMILWGGFQILMARDNLEQVKRGRQTIQWAVIGFAIILISKGVALILLTILRG
jgi:hypothetical protein